MDSAEPDSPHLFEFPFWSRKYIQVPLTQDRFPFSIKVGRGGRGRDTGQDWGWRWWGRETGWEGCRGVQWCRTSGHLLMRWCHIYITICVSPYCPYSPPHPPLSPTPARTLHPNDRCNVYFGYLLNEPPCTNTLSAYLTLCLLAFIPACICPSSFLR